MSAPAFLSVLGLISSGTESLGSPTDLSGEFSSSPVVNWQRPLPAPANPSALQSELGQPVLSGDRLYVGASQDNALLVLDRRSGNLLVRLPAAGPVSAPALLGADRVWFTDAAGYTWCYPLDSDKPLWKHFSGAPLLAPPTLESGRLYVANVDGVIFALDANSGELFWRHAQKLDPTRAGELELFGAPQPTGADGLILTGHSDGSLVALDPATGDVVWQKRVGEGRFPDVIAQPMVEGQTVYVMGYSEPMVALDLRTRAVRWRLDTGGAQQPTRQGEILYAGGTDGALRALDLAGGEELWKWDSGTGGALTQPILTPAGLLVGSAVAGLYLVDTATGTLLWQLETETSLTGVTVPPAVDGRQAVVLTNAGNLISLVVPSAPAPPAPRLPDGQSTLP